MYPDAELHQSLVMAELQDHYKAAERAWSHALPPCRTAWQRLAAWIGPRLVVLGTRLEHAAEPRPRIAWMEQQP